MPTGDSHSYRLPLGTRITVTALSIVAGAVQGWQAFRLTPTSAFTVAAYIVWLASTCCIVRFLWTSYRLDQFSITRTSWPGSRTILISDIRRINIRSGTCEIHSHRAKFSVPTNLVNFDHLYRTLTSRCSPSSFGHFTVRTPTLRVILFLVALAMPFATWQYVFYQDWLARAAAPFAIIGVIWFLGTRYEFGSGNVVVHWLWFSRRYEAATLQAICRLPAYGHPVTLDFSTGSFTIRTFFADTHSRDILLRLEHLWPHAQPLLDAAREGRA